MGAALKKAGLAALVSLATATPALSHWDPAVHDHGHDYVPGFADGFLHVLSGADHIALAVLMGVALALAFGGRSWRLGLALVLAVGAGVGFAHVMAASIAEGSTAFVAGIAAATVCVAALGGIGARLARRRFAHAR